LIIATRPGVKGLTPEKLYKFSWEKAFKGPKQNLDEMRRSLKAAALALGAKSVSRHPDDPPTILASEINARRKEAMKKKKEEIDKKKNKK